MKKMKKIYASFVMLLMASAAFAQVRTIQLEFKLVSPANGENLEVNVTSFDQRFEIKNLGPDAIQADDTVLYHDPSNTSPSQYYVLKGKTKGVGDTILLVRTGLKLTGGTTGTANYCVSGYVRNSGVPADSVVVDSVYFACNSINVTNNTGGGGGVGIFTVAEANSVTSTVGNVFPNPALGSANFVLNMAAREAVTVKITDLSGRVVFAEDMGSLNKGTQTISVNTSAIASGLYLYRVTMGSQVATGKLNIAK